MAVHFRSFKAEDIESMLADSDVFYKYFDCDSGKVVDEDCLEDYDHAISKIYSSKKLLFAGTEANVAINGYPTTVSNPQQIQKMIDYYEEKNLSDDDIIKAIENMDEGEVFHLEGIQDCPEGLIAYINGLITFYRKAVANNHWIVCYLSDA